MTVSRRLRFEILRRDGHTCRYCGAMAPDVALTVDHVIPVALGGSDDPTNLVAACDDCNGGKSSSAPDAPLVADVAIDMLRWRRAIEHARLEFEAERQMADELLQEFQTAWQGWSYAATVKVPAEPLDTGDPIRDHWHAVMGPWEGSHSEPASVVEGVLTVLAEWGYTREVRKRATDSLRRFTELTDGEVGQVAIETVRSVNPPPRPPEPTTRTVRREIPMDANWKDSVSRFLSAGLTIRDLARLTQLAMQKRNIDHGDRFRYFCGCAWREITDLQESARRIIEAEEGA